MIRHNAYPADAAFDPETAADAAGAAALCAAAAAARAPRAAYFAPFDLHIGPDDTMRCAQIYARDPRSKTLSFALVCEAFLPRAGAGGAADAEAEFLSHALFKSQTAPPIPFNI